MRVGFEEHAVLVGCHETESMRSAVGQNETDDTGSHSDHQESSINLRRANVESGNAHDADIEGS